MKKIIEVNNLTKEYKNKKAVDNLSFALYEGEIMEVEKVRLSIVFFRY